MRIALCAVVLLIAVPASAAAQPCQVAGIVTDATGLPLPGVTVALGPVVTATDERGRYCVATVPEGEHQLSLAFDGFMPYRARVTAQPTASLAHDVTLVPGFRQETVVTATRTSRRLDDVPVRTEVVGRDTIDRLGARTLADAIEFTTGVRVENNCQNCNFSQIRLLGLEGPYTQLLVDGQPVVSSLAQVYGIEQIPTRMIERIEVVKGGGSALYGPGSVGGVVNVISREPAKRGGVFETRSDIMSGEPGLSLNGASDWVSTAQDAIVSVFGQFDRVRPIDLTGDGYTEVSRRQLEAVGGRAAKYLLGNAAKLTLDVTSIREQRRGGNRLDLAPHEADIAESIRSRRQSVGATWFHTRGKSLDYRVSSSWSGTWRDSYYGTGRDPNAYGDTTSQLAVIDTQVNQYVGRHTLSSGFQFSREGLRDEQPAYGRSTDVTYRNAGVFLQDDWALGSGWELVYGARADHHTTVDRIILSPRVALMWSPLPAFDVRASVARGFRAPQLFDEDLHLSSVGGEARIIHLASDLTEERSTNYMLGAEWKPVAGPGQALVEVNGFSTRLTNLFHVIEQDDSATDVLEFVKTNLGAARVYGIEVNLGWGIGDDFIIQGGLVEQRARFDEAEPDFGSRDFFRSPRRYGNLTVTWNPHGIADFFAGVRYTGPMSVPHYAGVIDANRLERSPSFVTWDAGISRELGEWDGRAITLTVNGRNLTNAYQRDLDQGPLRDAAYVYGPRFPRSIAVGLRFAM
ncbi:MAG TPA: TonB-dependent receptor [Vicinamibacterales bacterium]|nr:TonB-dependent receptor [Vicinamibacterales bacterium]